MQQPSLSCIESRVDEKDNSLYGRFLIGPYRVGQGTTIANALRRSLLAEFSGLAITAIEIEGIHHEYSTIPGVHESVLDILLNIKQIVLTSNLQVDEPCAGARSVFEPQIAYLQVHGSGNVLAKNIKLPFSIKCINPEQKIATLSVDGILRMKLFICRVKSYKPSTLHTNASNMASSFKDTFLPNKYTEMKKKLNEEKKLSKILDSSESKTKATTQPLLEAQKQKSKKNLKPLNYSTKKKLLPSFFYSKEKLGVLLEPQVNLGFLSKKERGSLLVINTFFAPVNRVNFLLETDDELKESRERVLFEVWTNGSILPREAIYYAAKALMELLNPLLFPNFFPPFHQPLVGTTGRPDLRPLKKVLNKTSNKIEEELKRSSKLIKEKKMSSLDIANLELSLRSYTCLKRAGKKTVGDILKLSTKDLLLLENFGQRSLDELKRSLKKIGLSLLTPNKK